MSTTDPSELGLDELRELRGQLQAEDDVVSYVRRVAQARLDLVAAETSRRNRGDADLSSELRVVLSQHLTSGSVRPPRDASFEGDEELAAELDEICAQAGFSRLDELDADELEVLRGELAAFESRVSADRKARYERLDELSAELVRRYRDGEASVDGLLDD